MPKRRNDQLLLEDMLESIGLIQDYTQGLDYQQFSRSRLVIDAVVRNLEVIGEASRCISPETKATMAEIPWERVKGLQNRVIHEYFNIDLDIIWYVVQHELTPLQQTISTYLT